MSLRRTFIALLVAVASLAARDVRADPPVTPLRASIVCETPAAPGRFRCDVEVRVSSGTLSWADVMVTKTDDFILPLRGRLGSRDASTRDADIYRWSLGFVARERSAGDVTVRARAVVCHGQVCDPVETDLVGHVVVGR